MVNHGSYKNERALPGGGGGGGGGNDYCNIIILFCYKTFNCCYNSESVVIIIQKRVFESHFAKKRGSYKK